MTYHIATTTNHRLRTTALAAFITTMLVIISGCSVFRSEPTHIAPAARIQVATDIGVDNQSLPRATLHNNLTLLPAPLQAAYMAGFVVPGEPMAKVAYSGVWFSAENTAHAHVVFADHLRRAISNALTEYGGQISGDSAEASTHQSKQVFLITSKANDCEQHNCTVTVLFEPPFAAATPPFLANDSGWPTYFTRFYLRVDIADGATLDGEALAKQIRYWLPHNFVHFQPANGDDAASIIFRGKYYSLNGA